MTIYQENKSTILLSENGRLSSGKRSWHLNVRYFFIMDKLQKERSKWPTAVWKICSQTSLPSPYRVWHSEKCGTKSSICPPTRIDGAHRSVLAGEKKKNDGTKNDN